MTASQGRPGPAPGVTPNLTVGGGGVPHLVRARARRASAGRFRDEFLPGPGRSWRMTLGSGLPSNDERVLVHVDEGSVRLITDGERWCSLA